MIWLGSQRGYLSDWVTQLWVRGTGRRVELDKYPWLRGPSGATRAIGPTFFDEYAARYGLDVLPEDVPRGLVADLSSALDGAAVHPAVADFYERTS